MARRKIIAGNWKMNMTPSQAVALCDTLKDLVATDEADVVYCVPAIDIVPVVEAVKGTNVEVGAENLYFEDKGAYTGEISAEMLVDTARDSVEMPADTAGRFEKFLAERVKTALTAVVDEHKAQKKIGKKVLDRVNLLQDVSKQMAEELGREATVPELAQRLKMTEEEVKDTMKVALDALKALGED